MKQLTFVDHVLDCYRVDLFLTGTIMELSSMGSNNDWFPPEKRQYVVNGRQAAGVEP